MASNLRDIIRDSLLDMGELYSGVATGGSTTTLVDSGLKGRQDDWKFGTAFIDYDAAGAGADPEGKMLEISAYARATGTITTATWTTAPVAGDRYSVADKHYPLDVMITNVNRALKMIGEIPKVDTSLTTAANQLEYTIPAAARGQDKIHDIYIGATTTTADRELSRRLDWGTTPDHKLIFTSAKLTGIPIEIWYTGRHDDLWVYTGALSPFVNHELAVAATVYQSYRNGRRRLKGATVDWKEIIRDAKEEYDEAKDAWKKDMILPGPPFRSILTRDSSEFGGRGNKYGPFSP